MEIEIIMKYDVDVFITDKTPEDDFLRGPLSGGFCQAYTAAEKAANECEGGWADWEPYRCTFAFPSEEDRDNFCTIMAIRKEIQKYYLTYKKR